MTIAGYGLSARSADLALIFWRRGCRRYYTEGLICVLERLFAAIEHLAGVWFLPYFAAVRCQVHGQRRSEASAAPSRVASNLARMTLRSTSGR